MGDINYTYKKIADEARKKVLEMIYSAQSSHIGSNFSAIDLLAVLYNIANVDSSLKPDRDKVIISKGWIAASVYYFLAEKGIISKESLDEYYKDDSPYIGLIEPNVRGIEAAGGSMGFGLPFGTGFALSKKLKDEKGRVFVLMGDGEMAIGTTWESALIAAHHKLDNLLVIVDENGLQAMGRTADILNISPLKSKWEAFGWQVEKIDGHNYDEIEASMTAPQKTGKPKIVIAKTIKGKGLSFMENNNIFHYKAPSKEEFEMGIKELGEIK